MPKKIKSPIIISSRIFVPKDMIDKKKLRKYYSFRDFSENDCKQCKIYKSGKRYSPDDCGPCDFYRGRVEMWKDGKYKGVPYIGLPPANPERVEAKLGIDLSEFEDYRADPPFRSNLKLTAQLYTGETLKNGKVTANQVKLVKDAVKALKRNGAGIIKSLPRTGKTVMACAVSCHLKVRTLVLANKERLLEQFEATYEGSEKYMPFTNAKDESERLGRKVVVIVSKPSDFEKAEKADVVLLLYQKLIRETSIERVYDFILDKFGLVIVDETHRGSANAFAKLLARINPRYRLGLSATPKNKLKSRNLVLTELVGRVVTVSDSVSMPTRIEVFETGITIPKPHRLWAYMIKWLVAKFERNKMIVQEVFRDLRAGRKGILIPVQNKVHIDDLVEMINRQAEYNNRVKGEDWPTPLAVPYMGTMPDNKKRDYLNRFDIGEVKVMVAITSMVVEGVDLASPDMLYQVMPMSGNSLAGAPAFKQLAFRVATFTSTKKDPTVKLFVDAHPMVFYCFRTLIQTEIIPNLGKEYVMNKYDLQRAKDICDEITQYRSYTPPNKAGQRIYSKEILTGTSLGKEVETKATFKKKQTNLNRDGLIKIR